MFRMHPNTFTSIILLAGISSDNKLRRGLKRRFMYQLKTSLRQTSIDPEMWEIVAGVGPSEEVPKLSSPNDGLKSIC